MLFVFPHISAVHFSLIAADVAALTGPPDAMASVRNCPVIVHMYATPVTHTSGYSTSQNQKQFHSVMHF